MRRVQLSSAQVVLVDMKGDQRLPCGEVTQSAPPESPLRPGGPRYLHVTCYKLAYNRSLSTSQLSVLAHNDHTHLPA